MKINEDLSDIYDDINGRWIKYPTISYPNGYNGNSLILKKRMSEKDMMVYERAERWFYDFAEKLLKDFNITELNQFLSLVDINKPFYHNNNEIIILHNNRIIDQFRIRYNGSYSPSFIEFNQIKKYFKYSRIYKLKEIFGEELN